MKNDLDMDVFAGVLFNDRIIEDLKIAAKVVCTWILHDKSSVVSISEKAVRNLEKSQFTCDSGEHLVYQFDDGTNFTSWLFAAILCAKGNGNLRNKRKKRSKITSDLLQLMAC